MGVGTHGGSRCNSATSSRSWATSGLGGDGGVETEDTEGAATSIIYVVQLYQLTSLPPSKLVPSAHCLGGAEGRAPRARNWSDGQNLSSVVASCGATG